MHYKFPCTKAKFKSLKVLYNKHFDTINLHCLKDSP